MARYVTDDFKLREKYQSQRLSRQDAQKWLRTNNDWQFCIQGQEARRHLADLDPLAPLTPDSVIDSLPVLGPGDQALLIEQNNETPKVLMQWNYAANPVEMWLYHELKLPEGNKGSK